jgi:hypothetical protein
MGAIGFSLSLKKPASDAPGLHRAVWELIYQNLCKTLVNTRAGWDLLYGYLSGEASDGFSDGDWFCSKDSFYFSFGDAAGLCYMEMDTSQHWSILSLLDRWDAIQSLAAQYGTEFNLPHLTLGATAFIQGELKPVVFDDPAKPQLASLGQLLQTKQKEVFFKIGRKLACASQSDQPQDDHEISLMGGFQPLSQVAANERDKVADLIRQGLCACEVCQKLRAKYKLPPIKLLEPKVKPKVAKKPAAVAAAPLAAIDLANAPVQRIQTAAEFSKIDRSQVVALDLSTDYKKIPASVFAKLPSLPLKALGLKRYRTFAVPSEIFSCPDLEVLSLYDTLTTAKAHLSDRLCELTKLRAIDLGMVRLDGQRGLEALETLAKIPTLEIIDGYLYPKQFPASFAQLTRLRHLSLDSKSGLEQLSHLPLSSLSCHAAIPQFGAGPLRYFEGAAEHYPGDLTQVEFVTQYSGPVAEQLKGSTKLRGLSLTNVTSLPEWLADLPNLEFFQINNYSTKQKFDAKNFDVLNRLPALKALFFDVSEDWKVPAAFGEVELTGLNQLEWLCMREWSGSKADCPLPKGLKSLQNLRYVQVSSSPGPLKPKLPEQCQVLTNPNRWDPLDSFRGFACSRSSPEWWLSRFRVSTPEIFETFSQHFGRQS